MEKERRFSASQAPFSQLRTHSGSAYPDLLRGRLSLIQGGDAEEETDDRVRPCLEMHADVFKNVRCRGFEQLPDLSRQGSIA
ncbi:hypothetical protein [Streptomyces sp. NPDC058299]|uniref:hypothetical protein n=1 Tax=unclassified Streptomyces TaxID=2593676 RepID=UPI0036E98501